MMALTTDFPSSKKTKLILVGTLALAIVTCQAFCTIPQVVIRTLPDKPQRTANKDGVVARWTANVEDLSTTSFVLENEKDAQCDSSLSVHGLDQNRRDTLTKGGTAALLSIPLLKELFPELTAGIMAPTMTNGLLSSSSAVPLSGEVLEGDSIVRNLWLGRLAYPVLVVSLEIGLFQALQHGPLTKYDLGQQTTPKLHGRHLEAIVAVLASLELLKNVDDYNDHDGKTPRIGLTESAKHVLLADSPFYWGPQLLAADGLTGSLRRALHRGDSNDDATPVATYQSHSAAAINSFIDSMQAHGAVTAQATAAALQPILGPQADQPARHILDMAGGSGCFAHALVRWGCTVTLADIPLVVARFRRGSHSKSKTKIDAVRADLFASHTWPVGPDVHLLANVVHDWGRSQVLDIFRASRQSLMAQSNIPGACRRLVLVEQLLRPDGTGPLPAALASVSMLLGDWRTGKQYSYEELRDLLHLAGFARVELGPMCGNFHTAVIAYVE